MAIARVLLLAHAVSVLSQSVPAPSDQPGCTRLIVTTATTDWAWEQSWLISAGSEVFESATPLAENAIVENAICVEAGSHTITLVDSADDGWTAGSYVKIDLDAGGGSVLPETTMTSGGERTVTFDVSVAPPASPPPPGPPGPPPNPPGVKSHETCHLHIRGVRGGGDDAAFGVTMMQIAEVTIYDPAGVPLPVLTSSSDCEPHDGETSAEALDRNPFSKWRCLPNFDGATLDIEFDSSRVVGSYTLTTGDDHPERDPTNWTLSCVDVSGTISQLSVVDGVEPPEERKMVYGLQLMSSHPPIPPPAPPASPSPPLPPPSLPPLPAAPCWDVSVTTVTTTYASEQSWFIDGSKFHASPAFIDNNQDVQVVCLEMGPHTITLMDSFWSYDGWSYDGWSYDSDVKIVDALTGYVLLAPTTLGSSGSSKTEPFEVVGDYASPPPAPPMTPPGVTHHISCHIEFLSVLSGDMLQIGEITLYDTDGNALLDPEASSGCALKMNADDLPDRPRHAVDGDPATMWQCEFDETPKLTLEFDTAKHLGAYQITSAAMNAASPGGNPTSWTLTCSDRDGAETVLSSVPPMDACTGSVSTGCAPEDPQTPYDMVSLLPSPPAAPSPPALPLPPAPPPLPPCFHFKVKAVLTSWAYEQSWAIASPEGAIILERAYTFDDDYGTDEADVCLEPGAHTVCLYDDGAFVGDGWSMGSSLTIEENCGGANCTALVDGATIIDGAEGCFDFHSGLEPPSPPPSPPTAPPPPCFGVKVTTTSTAFASEMSWEITGVSSREGPAFNDNDIDETDVCLEPGAHTVCLRDSWGDGWSTGSSLTIEENCGGANCTALVDGATIIDEDGFVTALEECFDFHSGPAPPPPPPLPPAIPGNVFRYVATPMTRAEAQAHCMTMDTSYGLPNHLASVQNDAENAQVLELCQASSTGLGCWLGYSSSADNASAPWAWDDSTEGGYMNWDSGYNLNEPLQLSLAGDTVGAIMQTETAFSWLDLVDRTEGRWAAADPSLRRPFVCLEKYIEPPSPPLPPPPPPPLLPPSPPLLPPGARTFFGLSLEMTVSYSTYP
jgi:hypothetical protein